MVWFSERKELEKQYYEWIKENGIANQPNSVVAFLEINGLLNDKKVHEKAGVVKLKKTNFSKITESVESLAEFLAGITTTNFKCDTEKTVDGKYRDPFQEEKQGFIKWLQQEIDDE